MPLMQWDETMSVSIETIDRQHMKLIDLINEAYEAIQKHDVHKRMQIIDKMCDYALIHFASEEALLKEHGFPDLDAHRKQHAAFNEAVKEFKKKQIENTNLSQIFVFLSRWLTTHIMEDDMQYVSYMPKEITTDQTPSD